MAWRGRTPETSLAFRRLVLSDVEGLGASADPQERRVTAREGRRRSAARRLVHVRPLEFFMREAVIVSVARTPIGRAFRGAFNDTEAPALSGHVAAEAVRRAGVEPGRIEDVIVASAAQQGTQGYNIGRLTAAAAGFPASVAGMAIDRMCAGGLMAVASAAKQIVVDGMDVVVAGGVESISLTQNKHKNAYRARSETVLAQSPHMYMQMIETAEIVSRKYGVSREAQDEYSAQSQQRTAAAYQAGRFRDELAPLATRKIVVDKATNETRVEDVTLTEDEGVRGDTTVEGLAKLKPVFTDGETMKAGEYITAGNASQLSDGAAALVLMEAKTAEKLNLKPLGAYRGMAVAGCAPDKFKSTDITGAPDSFAIKLQSRWQVSSEPTTPPPKW